MRFLLLLGAGLATFAFAREARRAIATERLRRDHDHAARELKRWEGEGGNVIAPASATGTPEARGHEAASATAH